MGIHKPITLVCRISAGAFSDERVFEIDIPNSREPYVGAASRRYCWDNEGNPLQSGEPLAGAVVDGMIAARLLELRGEKALVSIPDGEVVLVSAELISDRPENARNVLIES